MCLSRAVPLETQGFSVQCSTNTLEQVRFKQQSSLHDCLISDTTSHGCLSQRSQGCHLEQHILWQAQLGALHDALSGPHPVHIPPQGVDFTIVANHSHGLRPAPAGEGVGAEPGVHQGHVGFEVRLLQVLVVGRHLHPETSVAW